MCAALAAAARAGEESADAPIGDFDPETSRELRELFGRSRRRTSMPRSRCSTRSAPARLPQPVRRDAKEWLSTPSFAGSTRSRAARRRSAWRALAGRRTRARSGSRRGAAAARRSLPTLRGALDVLRAMVRTTALPAQAAEALLARTRSLIAGAGTAPPIRGARTRTGPLDGVAAASDRRAGERRDDERLTLRVPAESMDEPWTSSARRSSCARASSAASTSCAAGRDLAASRATLRGAAEVSRCRPRSRRSWR